MISHSSTFRFVCDADRTHPEFASDAKTERTAIEHARSHNWDVLRVRAVSGVPRGKVARTVRLCFCPGCAHLVGVSFR